MQALHYRADIDGLRALAILPVLLFHADIPGFSGGFIGVDIFFVISGFLISSIIKREVENASFSYLEFWGRRARRILPASFVMVIATLIAAWFILLPADYKDLGKSAVYNAWFGANIFFAKNVGYFAGPSDLMPLLHTWSLSVEEQFYLFFPAVYLFIHKYLPAFRLQALIVLAFISLGISQYLLYSSPSDAFYLLHSRAWELLIGAILAHLCASDAVRFSSKNTLITNAVSAVGLLGIIVPVFLYNEHTPFPASGAIIPVIATAMIIWANTQTVTFVSRLLSTKVLVFIGLLSYSLYLWHWPVMSLTRHITGGEFTASIQVITISLSVILGYLSWKFVETPFRVKRIFTVRKHLLNASLVCLIAMLAAGAVVSKNDGFVHRLPDDALKFALAVNYSKQQRACAHIDDDKLASGDLCRLGDNNANPTILHFGDSHAEALYPAFETAFTNSSKGVLHASSSGCIPLLGAELYKNEECASFNAAMVKLATAGTIKHVVLSSAWSSYIYGSMDGDTRAMLINQTGALKNADTAKAVFEERLIALHQMLVANNVQLWLTLPVPEQKINIPHVLTKLSMQNKPMDAVGIAFSEYHERSEFVRSRFEALASKGVKLINPIPYLCDETRCYGAKDDFSLYKDDDHLSIDAAQMIAPMLSELANETE
ncbi:MAG: acyltransferase family protein [Glaciecola sp.]